MFFLEKLLVNFRPSNIPQSKILCAAAETVFLLTFLTVTLNFILRNSLTSRW